jgi:hypothetical protein
MNILKWKKFCSKFRISIGITLIVTGIITMNFWFFLGVVPLIAGLLNFCPIEIISRKHNKC